MSKNLITNQKQFLEICDLIAKEKFVALDTEFMRETTYFAVLCLIQLNVSGKCFVVDALAKDIDLSPFFKVLQDKKITKVFHSARQDIAVLAQVAPGIDPQSIIDTQIMASMCGVGYDIGYASIAKKLLDKDLTKEWQRSDWQARPLLSEQLEYAMIDVLYLPQIYQILQKQLIAEDKADWLIEEMELLIKKSTDDDLYRKFSFEDKSKNYQENVKSLVEWRDDLARKSNVPRSFVIKDKLLDKIAYKNPKNFSELKECGFETRVSGITEQIISLIQNENIAEETNETGVRKNFRMNEKQSDLYNKSRALLQKNAIENNLNAELIINQNDLRSIILGHRKTAETLSGWRFAVFGKDLENLLFEYAK